MIYIVKRKEPRISEAFFVLYRCLSTEDALCLFDKSKVILTHMYTKNNRLAMNV